MLTSDSWTEVAMYLPLSTVLCRLGLVSRALHVLCHNTRHVMDSALSRDHNISPRGPKHCSRSALRMLHGRPMPTFLPVALVDSDGGMWGANYGPAGCLTGHSDSVYCTLNGRNENVAVRVRPHTFPQREMYVTHVLAVGPFALFTAPLHRFCVAFGDAVGTEVYALARGRSADTWMDAHEDAPLIALRLPKPIRADPAQPITWHLLDSSGDRANIDVKFLGLYGHWLPAAGCTEFSPVCTDSFLEGNAFKSDKIQF